MTSIIYGPPKDIISLSEYVEAISKKPENNMPDTYDLQFLFRGHKSIEYDLCPSIARYKNSIMLEPRLIEQACNKLPDTFNKTSDMISCLAKMQHYGLPTRLVDFSLNPLVALYFACQTAATEDNTGIVIEINNHVHCSGKRTYGNTDLLFEEQWNPKEINSEPDLLRMINMTYYSYEFVKNIISSCISLVPDHGMDVIDFIKKIENEKWFGLWTERNNYNELSEYEKEICIAALLKSPIIVEAQELLERQRLQQGMYMLIPNKVEKEAERYRIYKKLPKLYCKDNRVGRYIIREQYKEKILKDLDRIGVNEGSLFRDSVDHVCNYMKSKYCH